MKFGLILLLLMGYETSLFAISIPELRAGGYAIFFRHTERDPDSAVGAPIEEVDQRQECRPGTQLNATGRANARHIHDKLQAAGIAVEKTFASPTCRTREMAEILTGPGFVLKRALVYPAMYTSPREGRKLKAELTALLAETPAVGKNRLFLSHSAVLPRIGVLPRNQDLAAGDAAVLKKGRLVGIIPAAEWRWEMP